MNLLDKIRQGCVDATIDLSSTLRNGKVLASKLKHEELKKWINNELNGYTGEEEIPKYRILDSLVLGTLSGPFGGRVDNVTIPTYNLPGTLRNYAKNLYMAHGVRELESLKDKKEDNLRKRWPAEAVIMARDKVECSGGYVLVDMWQPITVSSIEGILDTVRNKLLDFVLELEELDLDIIDSQKDLSSISKEKVNNIFNFTIKGDHTTIASGSNFSQTVNQTINEGDIDSLVKYLNELGIGEKDTKELEKQIINDGPIKNQKLGKNVANWFSKMIQKSIEGIWNISIDIAPKLLMHAFSEYYGW